MLGGSNQLVLLILLFTATLCNATNVLWKLDAKGRKVFYNVPSKNRSVTLVNGNQLISLSYSNKVESYSGLIREISGRHGVDAELVKAVIQVESNYNDRAISPKGARGLMQLMPATAARYGVRSIMDPSENIEGGVRYLKDLMQLFKSDLRLAVAAYNAGEGAVQRYNNDVPRYEETQNYVRKVLALYNGDMSYSPVAGVQRTQTVTYYKYVDARGVTHYTLDRAAGKNLSKVSFTYAW